MLQKKWLKLGFVGVGVALAVGVWQTSSFSASTGSSAGGAVPPKAMRDIEGHWAKAAIEASIAKGYIDGYEDQSFRPDQSVTRAEFVKMAVTALKLPASGTVTGAEWYIPYANAAVAGGIHQWSDYSSGDWNTPMTREEMARVAVRATGEKNDDAKKWMYLATSKGLIQGLDDTGTLGEDLPTNRAQSVTIIERIMSVRSGETLPADKHAISRAEVKWHKTNIFTVMPQYFGNLYPGTSWNPDDLFIKTPDGLYEGVLDELVAIDLEDPNDPFLNYLPDISTLKWHNLKVKPDGSKDGFPVSAYKNSYILYFKGRETMRSDSSIYADFHGFLPAVVYGAESPDIKAFVNGELNSTAGVFVQTLTDVPAVLIPKTMNTTGSLHIVIYAPARSPNPTFDKTILKARTPKIIE
ncbi:S-layer homology domain-containing protein [Paenibacillus sp. HJGM_3]|uniref:S-layer homology domain-containing protein n=1 Tax=Paenibacillus sp. HJGM_3 TaxID=3379816 RepID=UPI003860084F